MISNILHYIKAIIIFLPFILFQFFNKRANLKKENRHKQYIMPVVSVAYFIILFVFINSIFSLCESLGSLLDSVLSEPESNSILSVLKDFFAGMGEFIVFMAFNIIALMIYTFIKKITLLFFKKNFDPDSFGGKIAGLFYEYDEADNNWYLKQSYGQVRTFLKTAYYVGYILSVISLFISYELYRRQLITTVFTPVFSVLVIGEMAFFLDGLMKDEKESSLIVNADKSRHIAMYALLRKPLKKLFEDKLSADGTTINMGGQSGGAAEDILTGIEEIGDHIGKNYTAFMRHKIDNGLVPNIDYLRSGYDLATGNSLLFNTPFYDKLIPYAFYAVNRNLLSGKKVLVVMGRHGTEDDLFTWCQKGIKSVTNVSDLYKISILSGAKKTIDEDDEPDIGIITRSGVHDLDMHKVNISFLKKVGFVIIIEPSRLVTTAQIGLNLLIKCCGENEKITFCSVDRNCDGLVDSLSHILMTNLTEVSATEYPHGMSSFMCWNADNDYLQHRLFPGVSRYLGLGTELSFAALKNQVKEAVWYGGDAFPVIDIHWIAKQYYYDFLKYAQLATTQESFENHFKTSFNMCNESVSNNSYVSVEDDRYNLFEARRNFATIAKQQGFVNVISTEYMLREYMTDNPEIFTADAKAIPYITADYARTKRNSILTLCLLLCVDKVSLKDLKRKLLIIGIEDDDCETALWREIAALFTNDDMQKYDKNSNPVITVENKNKKLIEFDKESTLVFKRDYSLDTGKFEDVYTIENKEFAQILLDDLQNAGYIAEREGKDYYIGTELKGHIYQKYLPGQFLTLNGKYYEMVSATVGNRVMVRRASDHINGRVSYRQIRNYTISKIRDAEDMGALKTINNIDIHHLYADFEVETDGYWKLGSYNDFENGDMVKINGVPSRKYCNKQILKLDFSKIGEMFTESVRKTLTTLFNEVFVTLFAENQPFIAAVTPGECELPETYSLNINDTDKPVDNCIFIIEDSQLDIGLLVAVERNINRIMQIISDYLTWNDEKIELSLNPPEELQNSDDQNNEQSAIEQLTEQKPKKENIFKRFIKWIKSLGKKGKKGKKGDNQPQPEETPSNDNPTTEDGSTIDEPVQPKPDDLSQPENTRQTNDGTLTDNTSKVDEPTSDIESEHPGIENPENEIESDDTPADGQVISDDEPVVEQTAEEKPKKEKAPGKFSKWFKSFGKKDKKKKEKAKDKADQQLPQGTPQTIESDVDSKNESDNTTTEISVDNSTIDQLSENDAVSSQENEAEVIFSE